MFQTFALVFAGGFACYLAGGILQELRQRRTLRKLRSGERLDDDALECIGYQCACAQREGSEVAPVLVDDVLAMVQELQASRALGARRDPGSALDVEMARDRASSALSGAMGGAVEGWAGASDFRPAVRGRLVAVQSLIIAEAIRARDLGFAALSARLDLIAGGVTPDTLWTETLRADAPTLLAARYDAYSRYWPKQYPAADAALGVPDDELTERPLASTLISPAAISDRRCAGCNAELLTSKGEALERLTIETDLSVWCSDCYKRGPDRV